MSFLVQNAQIVSLWDGATPIADASAAARLGDWINMANHAHATIILIANDVADAVTFDLDQATDNAAAGLKAASIITDFWQKAHATDIGAVGAFTHVTQTVRDNVVTTAASVNLIVFEFDAEDLDADGGFDHFRVNHNDPGINAVQVWGVAVLTGSRYARDVIGTAVD